MKYYFLLLFFILIGTDFTCQTKSADKIIIKKDSIDYTAFSFEDDYHVFDLYKIRQFKGEDIYQLSDGTLNLIKWSTDNFSGWGTRKVLLKLKKTDTVVTSLYWDRDTKDVYYKSINITGLGLIKLDQKKDILYLTKEIEDPKTKNQVIIKKKFKVMMWNNDQIILKDISEKNIEYKRLFYFKRKALPYK